MQGKSQKAEISNTSGAPVVSGLASMLSEWLEFAEDQLSEFAIEGDDCNPTSEDMMCARCQRNGCLNLKIRNTRAALASAREVQS